MTSIIVKNTRDTVCDLIEKEDSVCLNLTSLNLLELSRDLVINIPQLQRVYLDNNQLTSIPENLFTNTPQLQRVYLDNNQLTSIPENLFTNTPQLQYICIV